METEVIDTRRLSVSEIFFLFKSNINCRYQITTDNLSCVLLWGILECKVYRMWIITSLSLSLFLSLPVCFSLSLSLTLHLSICLSASLFIWMYSCIFLCLYMHLSPFLALSVCLSLSLYIYIYIYIKREKAVGWLVGFMAYQPWYVI